MRCLFRYCWHLTTAPFQQHLIETDEMTDILKFLLHLPFFCTCSIVRASENQTDQRNDWNLHHCDKKQRFLFSSALNCCWPWNTGDLQPFIRNPDLYHEWRCSGIFSSFHSVRFNSLQYILDLYSLHGRRDFLAARIIKWSLRQRSGFFLGLTI